MTALVWFRSDLRVQDNPALSAAVAAGAAVLPVFIWAPTEERPWEPGAASRWWLHQSLQCLTADLATRQSRLLLRQGNSQETLLQLARETGATAVYWNRRYEPAVTQRDSQIKSALRAAGLKVESFNASQLWEPWEIKTREAKPFQVFTPFWRACQAAPPPAAPLPAPRRLPAPEAWPASDALTDLRLEPTIPWAGGLKAAWDPGEAGAARRLQEFASEAVSHYAERRDQPAVDGTSRLSPYLHFGEMSPRQAWHALHGAPGAEAHLRQLAWREFATHLLYHFPHTPELPLRGEFARMAWRTDADGLKAWQRGRTGYPIVDAGMRQLWTTGWMHNRVRMLVGSFLVKDLLIPWLEGARWFWDTLVDADLANNTLGWQWVAGCGADAAPYFRVFNPVLQGEKFDPDGSYVRRWVPELRDVPAALIHRPWEGILGDYPRPLVDHAEARLRALEALARMKDKK